MAKKIIALAAVLCVLAAVAVYALVRSTPELAAPLKSGEEVRKESETGAAAAVTCGDANPGEYQDCPCLGTDETGTQYCGSDGIWGTCKGCPRTDGAVCEPGRQVECACGGGAVGEQTCASEGTHWGECSCPD